MNIGAPEIARAKTMKALGFPWRPRVGDWYVTHTGYCELVRSLKHAQTLGKNGAAFLPSWNDARDWLAKYGWCDPEMQDTELGVSMWIRHANGRLYRAAGSSDLDCLYQVILKVLLGSPQ